MKVLPAIDLIDGKCVRLYQGDFNQTTQVGSDPETQLATFIADGAEIVHIVDLDGARNGEARQYDLIKKLCERSTVPIQVGGGIRTLETIKNLVDAGASRLVLGTAALEDEAFLKAALEEYAEYIVVGIDAKDGKVATRGWETLSEINYIDFAKKMEALGVKTIVFTDISRDGTMSGPNVQALQDLMKAVSCKIVASGGVSKNEDLQALADIGVEEVIVGKAIYEGKVTVMGVS
ncbi:1-(5-phosphoribosyl)-5-[(5-phosphoribosylamino)methylideneamino]imidazole-4-carboxamide isomerase [Aquibacillus koreensis]|uniref:1-(5-phosphoribosyl)-5-[(5-phosphoribosylamino)methylideneamino] imidazole-4-carboxamide isomerase n=1 Tax=Aquibacillus koreensis TaxID=279446 RepID=A0A9X4AJ14_9BACI|nr:1-(5-phosphoribosyl)-5-[(5-phosphoribosylamino)methylideneamino]imidazole-4-carboxamide isomerase [Aquibacillus koreensis]MCT2536365.1 1-(5-phosphoribosyl)-5-[(5-phosphoribosylamino)methylideneamino]imidazole-4-carboxamide isomerase [Aquibacillus koreensis]MDC3421284.1 1-(5-phosphoribosyl)-5-[(5-phosphoribosylamino)methylideneamino]imidazole-4-carboxamide isomerase [Aquibacillus koreensis]